MDENMNVIYEALAARNNWDFVNKDGRPYFYEKEKERKIGQSRKYAVPNATTTEKDKRLLAEILCEGSDEMKLLILKCWDNGLKFDEACSCIKEHHAPDSKFYGLHFCFIGPQDKMSALCELLKNDFPEPLLRENDKEPGITVRLDVHKSITRGLTKEESDAVFRKMNVAFDKVFGEALEEENSRGLQ